MRLREIIDRAELIEVRCDNCGARTPLDPAFFAVRRGFETDLDSLQRRLVCPGCGSTDFNLVCGPSSTARGTTWRSS